MSGTERTNVHAVRDVAIGSAHALMVADWLTAGAFILTIGSFLGAVLDSYTSLCTVGAGVAHIGTPADCPNVYGWDTRTFPLSIDMGWAGALLATVRLAHAIGLDNWRWWAVVGFEVFTAVTTIAGNGLHALIEDGVIHAQVQSGSPDLRFVALACLASAVPGVVAVGSGFTLNVLFSTRPERAADRLPLALASGPGRRTEMSQPAPDGDGREAKPERRVRPARQAGGDARGRAGRRPASEVLGLVRSAREQLSRELGRRPGDEEVAARGHPITASRVRTYLARLRAEERTQPVEEPAEDQVGEEVVAWRSR